MKVNVIGGGPGGLYFALLMKKLDPGHAITVYERDPAHNTYGWGIVLSQATTGSLRGADFETYLEVMKQAQAWEDVIVVHKGTATAVGGNEYSGIARIGFLNLLQARCERLGVKLQFEANVLAPDDLRDCDLLVGADGLKSVVRSTYRHGFHPSIQERANRFIWLGTPRRFDGLTMIFRQHGDGLYIAHAYPYSPEMSTFVVECDPQTWRGGCFAGKSEAETCAYLAEVFHDELRGEPLLSNASAWATFALVKNLRWFDGNVVLLGDALHTVHFSIGSGTKLAVDDAIALVGAFAENDGVQGALEAFERRRKPRADAFQDAALDSLLWLESVRDELHLDPIPFTYRAMTRSNRVGPRRVREQDPDFYAAYEAWRWEHEGPVPEAFLDLFEKKAYGHLASLLKDGRPHVTPVYVDYDGEFILINSARGRQKDLNMEKRRHVAIEITDPENPLRYLGVMGEVVEITEEGADEHLDVLARRYLNRDRYPPSMRYPGEVRRLYKVKPEKVIPWDPFGGW